MACFVLIIPAFRSAYGEPPDDQPIQQPPVSANDEFPNDESSAGSSRGCVDSRMRGEVFSSDTVGGTGKDAPASNLNDQTEREEPWYETLHDRASARFVRIVEKTDAFFGDRRFDEDTEESRLWLGLGFKCREEEGVSFESRVHARLSMPAASRKLQLIFDDDAASEDPDRPGRLWESYRDSERLLGFRRIFGRNSAVRFNVDAGARLDGDPRVFAKGRGRCVFAGESWEVRLTQTLRYCVRDLWKETSELRLTMEPVEGWLVRFSTACSWEETRNGVTPEQTISVLRDWGSRTSFRLDCAGSWPESPHTSTACLSVALTARRMICGDWFFIEASPGLEFHQEERYETRAVCTVLFDALFGPHR